MSTAEQPKSLLRSFSSELTTFEIVIGVVVSIILANLWQRFLNNFFYRTLGLDKKSAYVTFILALSMAFGFFVFLYFISSFSREVILGGVTGRTATHKLLGSDETTMPVDPYPRCVTCNRERGNLSPTSCLY
jgi:hypothetical protein